MSFSLSSLLNPEPAAAPQPAPASELPTERKNSLPPIQYVQSPEQHHSILPSPRDPLRYSYPPATQQEAANALASLASSNDPPPTQYYKYGAPDYSHHDGSSSSSHRRSSGYGMPIELPPPTTDARKMSSPTLDQYHVTSRSPEQRKMSMTSPTQPGFTLPPIQGFTAEQPKRPAVQQSPVAGADGSAVAEAHAVSVADEKMNPLPSGQSDDLTNHHQTTTAQPTQPGHSLKDYASVLSAQMDGASSPTTDIKQEAMRTPRDSSPSSARRPSFQPTDGEAQTSKAVASLKNEHGLRTQSPLRESSIPVLSTEMSTTEQPPTSKKRPAPSKTKKGTATASKKAPPSKKRKVEVPRSETPSSRVSKVPTLTKGTPANSSPAPSTRSYSVEPTSEADGDEEEEDDYSGDGSGDGDVYCICRKPDNGTFMIGCDGVCDDWFHGKCVGIEERDKNLIDKYICPNCTKGGSVGRTTWKRICRRSGCRQPARVGKNKSGGGKEGSKYCSEECGVLYFREMVARTRGREDTGRHRSNRRAHSRSDQPDDDLGAKGGLLAAGEVKSLLATSKTAADFKKLGEGVLSPPATPSPTSSPNKDGAKDTYNEAEKQALEQIAARKEEARRRHGLLKDRMKFVTMVKQAASRTAAEKELKPKEFCGYDPRLEWTSEEFDAWRSTKVGREAFELETLATEQVSKAEGAGKGEEGEDGGYADTLVCDRKKCARHLEWAKLAVDDLRFEMGDNSDRMRVLEREEREVKERAALRRKTGGQDGEGEVEVHGLGISGVEMEGAEGVPAVEKVEEVVGEAATIAEPMVVDAAA